MYSWRTWNSDLFMEYLTSKVSFWWSININLSRDFLFIKMLNWRIWNLNRLILNNFSS